MLRLVYALCFLLLSTCLILPLALAVPGGNSSAAIAGLFEKSKRTSVQIFRFNITNFTSEAEAKKLSNEVLALDPTCTNPIVTGPKLAEELAKVASGQSMMKLLDELGRSGELVTILANDAQTRRSCKVKRYKIYLLNGFGVAVNVF